MTQGEFRVLNPKLDAILAQIRILSDRVDGLDKRVKAGEKKN